MMPRGRNEARRVADIFISYTQAIATGRSGSPRSWRRSATSPHVHEWEIKGGDDIYAWMEQRHDAADHVLCVVSDEYLKAPYSTLERNAALWQAAAKRPGFVLFVAVKPCRLPTLSDHIRRCELFGVPEDAARLRFREFMQKREAPATAAFPGKVFARLQHPDPGAGAFYGPRRCARRDRDGAGALRGPRRHHGAARAARRRQDHAGGGLCRASSRRLPRDLVDQGADGGRHARRSGRARRAARLGGADEKEEPALAAVMERLRHEGEGILLIFDNAIDADALKPYLPRGGAARVLVTSNAHAWRGVAEPVEIRLWPKEIGADYLIARTGRAAERAAAEALSEALGGLPLAHEQAAAYCERLEISLAEYRRRFEAAPARMLDRRATRRPSITTG